MIQKTRTDLLLPRWTEDMWDDNSMLLCCAAHNWHALVAAAGGGAVFCRAQGELHRM